MKRSDFIELAKEILDFIDIYKALRISLLKKFFPVNEKIVDYLVRYERLYLSTDKTIISNDIEIRTDKALSAALGVLGDVLEKVRTHSRAIPPVQISFLTHNGDYYEIIYVSYGLEAMVTASVATQFAASNKYTDTTKRMVIVEDKSQMERLRIPGTTRFVLVQPDGSLSYYKGS